MAPDKEPYELKWITSQLAVGSAPMSYADLESIQNQGIQAVMNLCAEYCDLHWLESESGLEVYYLPIPDEQAPDPAELEAGLDWLDEELYLGRKVLVHCRFGIGRTGTVVKAYLLRKGLSQKEANRRLEGFRSQPSGFHQWWFLRKYGKDQCRLTVREPSLESERQVDLAPFFDNYEALVANLDDRVADAGVTELCGRDHDDCCTSLVPLSLAAAVYIHHSVGVCLGRRDREEVRRLAAEALAVERAVRRELGAEGFGDEVRAGYLERGVRCPLSEMGLCRIFAERPVSCRLADLPQVPREALRAELVPVLRRLSGELYHAYAGGFPVEPGVLFSLNEVLTGRFVQRFFHLLVKGEAAAGARGSGS